MSASGQTRNLRLHLQIESEGIRQSTLDFNVGGGRKFALTPAKLGDNTIFAPRRTNW